MRAARKAHAAQFAADVLPIIRDIQAAGHASLNSIAGQLNLRKVATANGGQWRHVQVRQILALARPLMVVFNDPVPVENPAQLVGPLPTAVLVRSRAVFNLATVVAFSNWAMAPRGRDHGA